MEFDNFFAYALILTRYRLGLLLRRIVQIYNRVMALYSSQNFVSAQHLKNINGRDSTKFAYTLILRRSRYQFTQSPNRVMALETCQNFV